jgi:hypothetical protein
MLTKKLRIIGTWLALFIWSLSGLFPIGNSVQFPPKIQQVKAADQKIFLAPGTTSWQVPSDWSDTNTVECIGPGGSGSSRQSNGTGGTGGGGGAYAKRTNIVGLSGTITVSVPAGGAGTKTIFNQATSGKEVICDFGRNGTTTTAGTSGLATNSVGTTTFNGGAGFKPASGSSTGGGGGGSAGTAGTGSTSSSGTGGAANNNAVIGGSPGLGNASGSPGNSGTEFDATHGSGSGGGGGNGSGAGRNGGSGGNYGGGGGGGSGGNAGNVGGAGGGGLIVITYTPQVAPTLSVSQPDGINDSVIVGDPYSITYSLADADSVVTATFYYDSDTSGLDGTAISGVCAAASEGTNMTCDWDTTGVSPGTYYIYGITNDGSGVISAYSSGTIVLNAVVVSVSVSTDGSISYGLLSTGENKSTIDVSDMQTVVNDGNVPVDLNIKTSNATGGTTWNLGLTAGIDTFVHEFSTNVGGDWTKFGVADNYQSLMSGLGVSSTQGFDLRVTAPTQTSDYQEKTIIITVQAVQP